MSNFEMKYGVPLEKIDLVENYLACHYSQDLIHPENKVCSVYYDTLDLKLIGEKLNSDFSKKKLRVRWYEQKNAKDSSVFFEIKTKRNKQRQKIRHLIKGFSQTWKTIPLEDFRWNAIVKMIPQEGFAIEDSYFPSVKIVYDRKRYFEKSSQTRFSLDKNIQTESVNSFLISKTLPLLSFPIGVLEIKRADDKIPISLKPLIEIASLKIESISKYLSSYLSLVEKSRIPY